MPRLSIDLTPQEHQQIKAVAALKGMSLKQFVLSRTLEGVPDTSQMSEEEAYEELARLLAPRIENARRGNVVRRSIDDIKKSARRKYAESNG